MRSTAFLLLVILSACNVPTAVSPQPAIPEPVTEPAIALFSLRSLSPKKGSAGDQVVAHGIFGKSITESVRVRFDDEWLAADSFGEERITFTVPQGAAAVYEVRVQFGNWISKPQIFSRHPKIWDIEPYQLGTQKFMRLSGSGFSKSGHVEVGSLKLPLHYASLTTAVVSWPIDLTPGAHDFRFVEGNFHSEPTSFEITPQLLYILPENVRGGEMATAYGANLYPMDHILLGNDRVYGEVTAPVWASGITSFVFSVPVTVPPGNVFRWTDSEFNLHAFTIWPTLDSVSPATAVTSQTVTIKGRNLGWGIVSFILEDWSASVTLDGVRWPCPCHWYPTVVTITIPTTLTPGNKFISLHPFEPYLFEPDMRGVSAVTTVTISP